jgi:hypothetical protein
LYGQPTRVDPIHLSHPNADSSAIACEQDRIRLHTSRSLPGKFQVREGCLRRRLTSNQLPVDGSIVISINGVGELNKQPAIDTPALRAATNSWLDDKDPEILLCGKHI